MSNKSNIVTCVCVFCCKMIPVHKITSISYSQFFEFVERFLQIDSFLKESIISSTENSNVQFKICQDCSLVTKYFCDLYHELKCVELQVQWKIQTLTNVMKVANRVPSRIKSLKEVFGQDKEEKDLNYQRIMKIRNELIMMCTRKLAKFLPRVTLLKLNGSPVLEKVNSETEPREISKTDFTSQFVSWVLSFTAVAMLCLTTTLDPINTSDEAARIDIDDLDNNVDLQVPLRSVIEETPIQMDNDSEAGNLDDLNQFEIFEAIEPERVLTQEDNGVILTPVSGQTEDHIGRSYTCSDDEEESNVVIEYNSNSQESQDQMLDNEMEIEQFKDVEQKPGLEIQRNVKIEYSNEKLQFENKIDKRSNTKRVNFVCQYCPKSFFNQHGLRLHTTQMHPTNSGPFFCKSCNRSLPNYQQYLGHRKSIMHLRRLKIQNEIKGSNVTQDDIIITENQNNNPQSILKRSRTNVTKRTCNISSDTDCYSSSSLSSSKEPTTVQKRKKYNLRSKRFTLTQKETSGSDTDSDSSSSSNSEDSSSDSSNEETVKPKRKPRTRKLNLKSQRWYCFKKGCNYQTENELAYKQHQKLHEPGDYKCMFCDVVEVNALKLGLHEERKHCNRKRKFGYYYCSRCPYLSQFKLTYIRHFTQFHLDFPNLREKMCPICKIATKNSSLHFKATHDISKVKPEDIVRCQINECTAYFINTLGLQRHRQEVHLRQLIRENLNSQDNYKAEFKCKICNICFAAKRERTKHRRVFHEQEQLSLLKETDLPLSRTKIPCPVLDCHKRFRDNESLNEHQKLHGSFSCQFCSVIMEYAPDLATHELEHNSESSESSSYKCPRCSFKSIRQLTYVSHHLEEHLGVTDKIIPCKICGKRFRDHLRLLAHFKHFHDCTNKTMKIKTCSKCPCYYRTQLQLWRHQLSCHEYIFCQKSDCNEKFKKFRELKEHLKLHGSFKCQFCEIAVKYAPDLPIHELEHATDASSLQSICCPRCSTVFKDKRVMITHHLAVHMNLSDKGFVCNVCCERLRSSEQKSHHIGKYHGTKLASNVRKCNQCPAYFLMDTQLTKHQEMVHGLKCPEEKFICDIENCNLGFRTELELNDHKTWHGNFKCQFCSVCVTYAPDLIDHELEHHASTGKKTGHFKCPRCNSEKFKVKPTLLHHFLEEHLNITSKVYRCPICLHPAAIKGHINRHIMMAHKTQATDNQEFFSCLESPATFLEAIQLAHHNQSVHKKDCAPVFECKLCDKLLKCKKSVQSHMKRFHDIESTFKFVCTQQNCNRRFQTKYDLELHLLHSSYYHDIKSGKKELVMYKCDKCGRECKGIGALKVHMKVHREGRPTEFKCEQCAKVFKSKAALEAHSVYHKGPNEWKFMCAICSKKCADKPKLDEHTRTHTKEKPFVCQICGEMYAHRHNLRNHVKSKHNAEGLQVGPPKARMRFYVSRKGKKLGKGFCFTQQQNPKSD